MFPYGSPLPACLSGVHHYFVVRPSTPTFILIARPRFQPRVARSIVQEDELVMQYVAMYGTKQWARIAQVRAPAPPNRPACSVGATALA